MTKTYAQARKPAGRLQRVPLITGTSPGHLTTSTQVRQIVGGPRVQAKLVVGPPDDVYENEAERVADAVMRMPEAKEFGFEASASEPPQVQRLYADCQAAPKVLRLCSHCEDEVHRKTEDEVGEKGLQREEASPGIPEVTPNLESRINSLRGGGQPLPTSIRAFFEPRFGQDFSNVRLHIGSVPAEIAHVLHAKAFTTGNNIVLGNGQYEPGSGEGKKLLAHELTHVVQQEGGRAVALRRAPAEGGSTAPAASSALSAPSVLETLEISETEPVSAQFSRIALFAKKVLGLPQTSLAGSIVVTCYWRPDAGINDKANAERRAEEARSALMITAIPADKISASAQDASLLSPPAPPSGLVQITFFPDQLPSARAFSMLRPQPEAQTPISLHLPKTARPSVKDFPQRKGTLGDALKAIASLPSVDLAIKNAWANFKDSFEDLQPGEFFTLVLAADAIASIVHFHPDALNLLDGVKVPLPGFKGIEIQFAKASGGAMLHLNLTKLVSGPKRPQKVKQE